eukprot:366238-Chlamydomonas_euryale.AAC.5
MACSNREAAHVAYSRARAVPARSDRAVHTPPCVRRLTVCLSLRPLAAGQVVANMVQEPGYR